MSRFCLNARRKEGRIQILRSASASSSHLKTLTWCWSNFYGIEIHCTIEGPSHCCQSLMVFVQLLRMTIFHIRFVWTSNDKYKYFFRQSINCNKVWHKFFPINKISSNWLNFNWYGTTWNLLEIYVMPKLDCLGKKKKCYFGFYWNNRFLLIETQQFVFLDF